MQMHQDAKPRCGILVHLKRRIRHGVFCVLNVLICHSVALRPDAFACSRADSNIVYVRGTHLIGLIIFCLEVLI